MNFADNVIDLPWQNFLSLEFETNFQREVPSFLEISKFPYNTEWDKGKEASVPKTSSIHPVVSIQYGLVMDRRRDGHTAYTMLA